MFGRSAASISHQQHRVFSLIIFISLFYVTMEEVGGDDLHSPLLTWQKQTERVAYKGRGISLGYGRVEIRKVPATTCQMFETGFSEGQFFGVVVDAIVSVGSNSYLIFHFLIFILVSSPDSGLQKYE
ncbi:hypothetical protein SLA2020_086790 [Shorea laevis]